MQPTRLTEMVKREKNLKKIEHFVLISKKIDAQSLVTAKLVQNAIPENPNTKINSDDAELLIFSLSKLVFNYSEFSHEVLDWFGDILSEIATEMGLLDKVED